MGAAVLTRAEVEEIRSTYLSGQISMTELACCFNVARSTIQAVLEGNSWPKILEKGEAEALARVRASRRLYHNGNGN